jgi:hypothetical protein
MVSAAAAALFTILSPSAPNAESLVLGGRAGWADIERRYGVVEAAGLRNVPVLTLSSSRAAPGESADLDLTFDVSAAGLVRDRAGRYDVSVASTVSIAPGSRARSGSGAVLFAGAEGGVSIAPNLGSDALFRAGNRVGDFSIEFWLYPANLENGEQLLSWSASRANVVQRLRCLVARNRIEWTFLDFFTAPDGIARVPVSLSSRSAVVPRTWSHHLIRFDAKLGSLEYLVDGELESIAYATSTGTERGEPYLPIVGGGGVFTLGGRFTGMIDEFSIQSSAADEPSLDKYPREGGRVETKFLDLETSNAAIKSIDATFAAPGLSAIRFFVRASDNPYRWKNDESSWIPVEPGRLISNPPRGRWAQVAAVLYPDGGSRVAPVLEELRVHYERDEAPPPPSYVVASAREGAVELAWRPSPDPDLGGYLIYYGTDSGDYFGVDARPGASPIDVGLSVSFIVDGLRDGALYYFAVAAYDRAAPRHIGAFSREVAARPARTVR